MGRLAPLIEAIDIKRMHCPECRKCSIWRDPTNGEYCCTSCAIVINESEILDKYHSSRKKRTIQDIIKK